MPYSQDLDVRVTDTSLRDGSHAKRHQFIESDVRAIVAALDAAGMPVIEVSHGDGLGGSSYNYGKSLVDERKLIAAAVDEAERARIAALMLPGLGTKDDIKAAHELGVSIVRVATHCTEADIAEQHFGLAREIGLETVGFLMMSHTIEPEALAVQARVMAEAGCQCVYVVDSAGAMVLEAASERVEALVNALDDDVQVGFHGHENLSLSLANTVHAIRAGAVQVDGSTRRFGAGSGNTSCEALAAVTARLGISTGLDVLKMIDAAEDVVRPVMDDECVLDRMSLIMGYAGGLLELPQTRIPGCRALRGIGRRRLVGLRRARPRRRARGSDHRDRCESRSLPTRAQRCARRPGAALGDGGRRCAPLASLQLSGLPWFRI